MDNKTIICRCKDITLEELRQHIKKGYTSYDELKRVLRIGMGQCQGRTCGQHVLKEIASITGKDLNELKLDEKRPPAMGIKLQTIADGGENDEEDS